MGFAAYWRCLDVSAVERIDKEVSNLIRISARIIA
jgi:hypothetical protein